LGETLVNAKDGNLTQDLLKELFDYDAETGNLIWRVNRNNHKALAGDVAGTVKADGYRKIRINGRRPYAHRIVWLWHHGSLPDGDIDHIDNNPLNNRIENLREATNTQNQANKSRQSNNTSGYPGVVFHKATGKWNAKINVDGRRIHLGLWDNKKQAHIRYLRAASKLFGDRAHHMSQAIAERAERARIDAFCDAMDIPMPPLTPECLAWEAAYQARRAARLAAQQ
jgi:HNH endonuclease/AP2 domain